MSGSSTTCDDVLWWGCGAAGVAGALGFWWLHRTEPARPAALARPAS